MYFFILSWIKTISSIIIIEQKSKKPNADEIDMAETNVFSREYPSQRTEDNTSKLLEENKNSGRFWSFLKVKERDWKKVTRTWQQEFSR